MDQGRKNLGDRDVGGISLSQKNTGKMGGGGAGFVDRQVVVNGRRMGVSFGKEKHSGKGRELGNQSNLGWLFEE